MTIVATGLYSAQYTSCMLHLLTIYILPRMWNIPAWFGWIFADKTASIENTSPVVLRYILCRAEFQLAFPAVHNLGLMNSTRVLWTFPSRGSCMLCFTELKVREFGDKKPQACSGEQLTVRGHDARHFCPGTGEDRKNERLRV